MLLYMTSYENNGLNIFNEYPTGGSGTGERGPVGPRGYQGVAGIG
jgi:hypothetical protein